MGSRLRELHRWARARRFDAALAHGSYDLTLTARRLRIPSTTTFDYEFALAQHQLGARAATRVVVPEAIPANRLSRYGLRPPKLARYPGLKEEYYLADFEPDLECPRHAGRRSRAHLRRTPTSTLTFRSTTARQPAVSRGPWSCSAAAPTCTPSSFHEPTSNATTFVTRATEVILPVRAVDAQSLIASADLVISGRRDDEPRGGRTRRSRLHDLPGQARRRGRAVDPRRPATRAHESDRHRRPQARDAGPRASRRDPREMLGILLPPSGYA